MVHRRLYHDTVARAGEVVDSQGDALYHSRHEAELVAGNLKAVALALPVDYRLPVAVGRGRVSQHGVLEPAAQGLRDIGAYGKVEVGNPQRGDVAAAKHLHQAVVLGGAGAAAVNHAVEIIFFHGHRVRRFIMQAKIHILYEIGGAGGKKVLLLR